ncbi:MAG: phosphate acetyltransferase, partial [Coriobacteriaceae bacterium]|nr:phosphate acetyltransferase [Coriobacteriaceae bacterium]
MSTFLNSILARAKSDKQTIVLPEGDDTRTLEAAETILREGIAHLIILGDAGNIAASPYELADARIIDPRTADNREELAEVLYDLRKEKGLSKEDALALMDDVLYYGVMLVKTGAANGMVAGASHSTGDVLRPCLQILKTAPGIKLVSAFFVMVVPDCAYGEDGIF